MWMMLQIIPIMWRAVRPSRVADMPAVVNSFWLRKGFEGLTFFGKILTPTQVLADEFNEGYNVLKNHEMIHLRQAQSCGDSWLRFYLLYLWYWLRALPANRKLRHGAYLLNPFEMEAYRHMNDLNYLERCEDGAQEWRRYAKMPLKERLRLFRPDRSSRSKLLSIILLLLFMTLNVQAQDDDEDIAHSLNLTEVVVLADGMTFEEYLLKQVLAHAKPLKERTKTLRYTVTCQLEKDMDLSKFPHRRTITLAARLAGYGPIVSALREHKHFGITVAEDVLFQNGKIKASNARMVEMKQKLTDKQIASFLKHDGFLSTNIYDKFYKMVRDKVKDLQKMRKKKRDDVDFRYIGSYASGNRTFYIVKLDNVRVHIADRCWQISRISYHEGQNDMQYEFKEVKPDLFLLSHGKAKLYIDKEKWPQGFVSMKLDYDYK